MKTTHKIIFNNSKQMDSISANSIDLIVTSPPYPMIEMWDENFCAQNPLIRDALNRSSGLKAFELMHKELDRVWNEIYRVLKEGRFACINIGDATRTINEDFQLYSNHARILNYLLKIGFSALPDILWRKQTNAPNKFMGSGMLPAGAYVTLEHEYILIVRKGSKREFKTAEEKRKRRESAIFWEERNIFFSDVWMDIKGTTQGMCAGNSRLRSGAYPFELAYRLINMYSAKEDIVLDPFLGTGTTMAAAMAAGRNSIGFEVDRNLRDTIHAVKSNIVCFSNQYLQNRVNKHIDFVADRIKTKGALKHKNKFYGFPVITGQERELIINELISVKDAGKNRFEVSYSKKPQSIFCKDWCREFEQGIPDAIIDNCTSKEKKKISYRKKDTNSSQLELFV